MLIDTNVIIWMLTSPDRFGKETQHILKFTQKIYISIASQYEIAIKERLGRFELLEEAEKELSKQFITQVPITIGQLRQLAKLKNARHRDPFDLLIIALAIERNLTLVTADKTMLNMKLVGLKLIDARR